MAEKLITLAIHTYDHAVSLRDMLMSKGVQATLDNVDIKNPTPACGVRVRIPENQLPKALRIIETPDVESAAEAIDEMEGVQGVLLVPTDFSSGSENALKVAFALAERLKLTPLILHVFATPYFDGSLSLTDNFTLDIRDSEVRKNLYQAAHEEMRRLRDKLKTAISSGELPDIHFDTQVREGLPEDVILEYTRETPPRLVVMGTRGAEKKSFQMLGSVAAEVVDSCRVPVFTIPEDFALSCLSKHPEAIFFCNVDQHDILAMDMFISLLDASARKILLVPANDKSASKLSGRMEALAKYFRQRYPAHEFSIRIPEGKDLRVMIEKIVETDKVNMLVVPNKKKNVFARLFNPGIPHRVIFEANAPMLALPV